MKSQQQYGICLHDKPKKAGAHTVACNHYTTVQMREGDALNPAMQTPRKHVTPHGSLFVDKPNSSTECK